ncbi:MAG TPA: hypothetical protein VIJ79_15920 [Acidobacteriaceae bacterium]
MSAHPLCDDLAMDENGSETNLQAFVRALHEAYHASSAVDSFDLQSENSISVREWNSLLESQRMAFQALHEVCCRIPIADLMDG